MLRYKKAAIVNVAIVATSLAATCYVWWYFDRGPTWEEFRVYDAFLSHIASDYGLRQTRLVLEATTLKLSNPHYDSWIPTELRADKTWPNPSFVSFCGRVCTDDFVRKNLVVWQLKPSPKTGTALRIVGASETLEAEHCAISVTRVGFDLNCARAVLSYVERCDGYGGMMLGDAHLLREDGMWKVKSYQMFTL